MKEKAQANLAAVIGKYDLDVLGYLLFDDSTCVIFSLDPRKGIMESPIHCEYKDLSYVNLEGSRNLEDVISLIDTRSEICEVRGYDQYLDEIREQLRGKENKVVIYLPLVSGENTMPYQLRLVKFPEEHVVLGMITLMDVAHFNLERLYAESYKDHLTGLFNKAAFEFHSGKSVGPHYYGFFDLDGFKSINDRFSHSTGDQILRTVGERLIAVSDDNVIFYRLGGDEFAFMTNGMSYEESASMVSRIRIALLEIDFFDVMITASFGMAYHGDEITEYTIQETLVLADIGMYYSKSRGGNQLTYVNRENAQAIIKDKTISEALDELMASTIRHG